MKIEEKIRPNPHRKGRIYTVMVELMLEQCPKCGTQKTGESCPTCGLNFAKFDPAIMEGTAPEPLIELWGHTMKNWNDRSRHALFVETAIAIDGAGYAASCYRQRSDDPIAKDQLQRIQNRLLQSMTAQKDNRRVHKSKKGLILLFTCIALLVLLAILLFPSQ